MILSRFQAFTFAFLALSVALAGCSGGDDRPELGNITGLLSNGGKPVAGATLEFFPEKGRQSFATSGPDGRFTAEYGPDLPGGVVGKHRITVTLGGETAAESSSSEPVLTTAKTRALPGLFEVKPGDNTFDIDLAKLH